jgi:uncharacterized protein YggU (UPF0235/DUF167 family)
LEKKFLIDDLLQILKLKKLRIEILEQNTSAAIIAFDVWAKPGARVEKKFVGIEGVLVVQTRSKPIEGEANGAIIEAVSATFGVPKSSIEIIRGEKSRQKRIKLLIEFTANKKESFYQKKFTEILTQEVSD